MTTTHTPAALVALADEYARAYEDKRGIFDLEGVKSPAGRVMAGRVAQCLYVIQDVALPSSVYAHNRININKYKGFMQAKDGTDCPCWSAVQHEGGR